MLNVTKKAIELNKNVFDEIKRKTTLIKEKYESMLILHLGSSFQFIIYNPKNMKDHLLIIFDIYNDIVKTRISGEGIFNIDNELKNIFNKYIDDYSLLIKESFDIRENVFNEINKNLENNTAMSHIRITHLQEPIECIDNSVVDLAASINVSGLHERIYIGLSDGEYNIECRESLLTESEMNILLKEILINYNL